MASSTAHPAPPGFVVEQVHPPQLLVLHSNSFVPAAWRARLGGLIDFSWTWTFALADTGEGGTRLLRTLGTTGPWWLSVAYLAALVPADDALADSMLAGVHRRADRHDDAGRPGRWWRRHRRQRPDRRVTALTCCDGC